MGRQPSATGPHTQTDRHSFPRCEQSSRTSDDGGTADALDPDPDVPFRLEVTGSASGRMVVDGEIDMAVYASPPDGLA